MLRRLLLVLIGVLAGVLVTAAPVSAHNSLVSSDPAPGATVASAPTQLTLVFDKDVPLDTVSIELIDARGVRSDLDGSSHGPNGSTEVVTPLPALPPGAVNLRWRLVGPDGHPITGRIAFTIISPSGTSTTAVAAAAAVPLAPAESTSTTVLPPATSAVPIGPTDSVPSVASGGGFDGFDEPWSASGPIRWLLRMVSYLGIMTVAGVLATVMFVWPRAWSRRVIRRAVQIAIGSCSIAGVAQLLVVASDISGHAPWASLGDVTAAFDIDAGVALAVRLMLLAVLAWIMFSDHPSVHPVRWLAAASVTVALLGTWAYAGHSRSMRWPLLGVPLDVAHHAAAGAWVGGLAIVGLVTLRDTDRGELVGAVGRFGTLASVSVGVLVVTGVLQAIRLVGTPTGLFDADHGRYLMLKVIILAAMLKVADINRQRVSRRFQDGKAATGRVSDMLRRAMGTELAVGLAIIGVTAALVVSPPAVADDDTTPTTPAGTDAPVAAALAVQATTTTAAAASATPAVTATACPAERVVLAAGSTGPAVLCLQRTLTVAGLYTGSLSSVFDEATDLAVRAAQQQHGLLVDGVVGEATATALGIWSRS